MPAGRGAGRRPRGDGRDVRRRARGARGVRQPRRHLRRRVPVVAVMYLALYALVGPRGPDLFAAILRIAPVEPRRRDADPRGRLRRRRRSGRCSGSSRSPSASSGRSFAASSGWRLAPAHFVERHGLIVIIAIGESLVAIGLGARATDLERGRDRRRAARFRGRHRVLAGLLRLLPGPRPSSCSTERHGAERVALARDVYTYLHLPMVAGIVLFAFAMKVTLAHVGTSSTPSPPFALCGGPALYLSRSSRCGRVSRTVGRGRPSPPWRASLCSRSPCGAGARRARARRGRLGRAARLRADLVAGGAGGGSREPVGRPRLRPGIKESSAWPTQGCVASTVGAPHTDPETTMTKTLCGDRGSRHARARAGLHSQRPGTRRCWPRTTTTPRMSRAMTRC